MSWVGTWLGHWIDGWLGGVGGTALDRPGCLSLAQALVGDLSLTDTLVGDLTLADAAVGSLTLSVVSCATGGCCMAYDIGDVVRLTGTFENSSGVNTDPTTVTLKTKDPSGNIDTYTYALSEVTRSAAGIFYKDVTIDESGIWYYRFTGTGTVAAAEEGEFEVRDSQFD